MAITGHGNPGGYGRHALWHVELGIKSENECVLHMVSMDSPL